MGQSRRRIAAPDVQRPVVEDRGLDQSVDPPGLVDRGVHPDQLPEVGDGAIGGSGVSEGVHVMTRFLQEQGVEIDEVARNVDR